MRQISNQTILLADDDDSLRRVLEFQLSEAGFQVLTAEKDGNLRLNPVYKYKPYC